ncbi:holo-ACP synthase [Virgibacillus sp. SK37]|uniref:holo-ACP synthase n=1 Tax=Virgibacillus sp. SK37 TaxID=403957 RepID=UPI0004D0B455|nr:holo-ACP synthase [Virgibacillus sp. SK37]AIF42381.1 4'-phosphopantetheinyl transferase [Virgibacillus sp. SK37]
MIEGIGIDLVEIQRIKDSFRKNGRFAHRILTENEQIHFQKLPTEKRKMEFLAGRFAGKEAFAKATGTGIGKLSFQDIEITTDENGAPYIKVKGYEAKKIFISISHSEAYATAQVIIEAE